MHFMSIGFIGASLGSNGKLEFAGLRGILELISPIN